MHREPRRESLLAALRRVPLFAGLDEAFLTALARRVATRRYAAGEFLYHEGRPGDTLYFVQAGRVRVFKTTAEGHEKTIEVMGAGDVMAAVSFLDGGPYPASAVAIEPSVAGTLSFRDLEGAVREHPEIALQLLRVLGGRLRRAHEQIAEMAFAGSGRRVARALLRLFDRHGEPTAAGPRLPAEFSHAEIARAAGTSRETVTRILGTLRRAGIVGEDGGLVLLDRPSLEDWT